MKKFVILLFLLVFTSLLVIKPTYASETVISDEISDNLTWTRAASNGYYYIQSNRFQIDFSSIEMELNTSLGDWTQAFVAIAGEFNSVVEIYEASEFGAPLETYQLAYESPEVPEVMFLFDDGIQDYVVDTEAYLDNYMQITIMLNPNPDPTPGSLVNNVEFYMNNYRNQYDFIINTNRTLLLDQTIADLPLTAGNPYQTGLTGTVWDYAYDAQTGVFGAKVQYYQEYNISITNVGFSDPSFLDRVSSVDYYTIEGEKFFQFNFLSNPNVLLTGSGQFAQEWNGFAVWNLTTNEFVQYNKALALTYIEVTENREIFGYLYLPGIPIDDVLAVSGNFNYRYGYKNIFGTQKYDDWEKSVFHLEKDEQSYGATSIFEGALPQWSYDLLGGSLVAIGVGSILSMVPGLQVIGLPLLAGGVAGIVATNVSAVQHVKTGLIDEIQLATLTPQLRNTLNEHYTIASNALTVLPSNAQVHKLFFGLFTKTGSNVVEPDASSLAYTEISWATQGQVYTLDEKFIDSEAVLDQDYQNNLPPEGEGGWFEDTFGESADFVKGLAIVLAVLYVAPHLDKGTNSISNILKNPRKLFITAVIIFVLLLITGVIVL